MNFFVKLTSDQANDREILGNTLGNHLKKSMRHLAVRYVNNSRRLFAARISSDLYEVHKSQRCRILYF